MKELEQFLKEYEARTNNHHFDNVAELIDENAIYWFSSGSFEGIKSIRNAFESTWEKIQNEAYSISDLNWLVTGERHAVCIYTYHWKGMIDGVEREGRGRGTNVVVKKENKWVIIHEHLSLEPKR